MIGDTENTFVIGDIGTGTVAGLTPVDSLSFIAEWITTKFGGVILDNSCALCELAHPKNI